MVTADHGTFYWQLLSHFNMVAETQLILLYHQMRKKFGYAKHT